ncbi:zinc finger protein DZIP1L isoform X2 [Meleagris gallopavo]|uniref:zinc finger protein DZIP1L isoform X2 n=1 Tax=Meleagris gallopavo TaxID=9103 RepID=UPI0012ABAC4D|nr:zinc finger protein DZIP1L isoform X2 [Meleagris gallopavo]
MAMLTAPPALTIPPNTFCFQPRRLAMDRHRLSAVDVERVAREGDVAVLQEHISNITFCNVDGERCPHCRQPADPVLLTVLRLAQLSIEYLLHCQQHLADSLAAHAQHLQDARAQLARAQGLASEQAARLRGEKEESRRWKKLVATQLLLQARPSGYCKGAAGAGRSHPRSQWLCSPGFAEAKKVERMEEEVEELKAKLHEMQQQLAAGKEAEKLRREQEEKRAHQQEAEDRRDFERWKEEERMKLHVKMDGLRQLFFSELQDAASRSSAMEGKLQELQARAAVVSSLGTLQDDDSELERTAVQTKLLSANKPKVTQQVTRAVVSEESSGAHALLRPDTADDAQSGKKRLLEALWRKPNLLKKFRRILEEALEERLESMGISRVAKGISTQTYQHLQAVLRLQQQQKVKNSPGLLHLRNELIQVVMRRVRQLKKPSIPLPRQLSIIPGTAVSMKGKPLERHLDVKTQRPASGMKSHP